MTERRPSGNLLGDGFVRAAKAEWSAFGIADTTRPPLSRGRVLVASALLSKWIRRRCASEDHIGLLLPASVGGAIANIAASMAGKVVVNLNFTAGPEAMATAIARCEIRTILTARVFLERVGIPEDPRMVFLEDVMKTFGPLAKAWMLAVAFVLPASLLSRLLVVGRSPDDPATVVFSSGSTGTPKGVVLTQRNIASNVEAVQQVFDLGPTDVMLGSLPLFHSFGYTGTLWFPALSSFGVVYHPNPTDAKAIGELSGRYGVTILLSTSTFCGTYVRKIRPEQFARLRYAVVGAEKLRESVANAFKNTFGISLLEGYGCTEMAPIVAVNRPAAEGSSGLPAGNRPGTVGQPIPGVVAKVVDLDTGEGPLIGREGLLLLNGPNRMAEYLGDPDKTREALRDGWYISGDIASIDEDGFIRITDRLARFSKIGGEMVPHLKIEECVNGLLAAPHVCLVTAVPDEARGERLVALFTDPSIQPQAVWVALTGTELPRLWIPKREDIHFVESIPTLPTGKTDLRAVRELASRLSGEGSAERT